MKLNKKVLGMLMSGALVFGMVGCSSDESNEGYQPKQETKQEQQYEEQEQQEQQYEEPKDESLNEEYNNYSQSEAQQVKELMTIVCEKTFSTVDWEVIEQDGIVYVNLYIPYNELANTSVQSWNELVNVTQEQNYLCYNELVENGYNVPLTFTIGSRETNEYYYIVMNGQVMFDAVNGINKLN